MAVRFGSKSSIAQGLPKGGKAWDQVSSTNFAAEMLLVGGGGGGGADSCYGGGGGAGEVKDLSISVGLARTYSIVIGPGGPAGGSGGSSSTAFGYTAVGGGNGNNAGGSGPGVAGGTSGNGYTGGNGQWCPGCCASGGGGGGSTGYGSGAGNCSLKGTGGSGYNWKSLGTTYAVGGNGKQNCTGSGNGAANTGNGGNGASNGGSGICIIRYLGTPKATGGSITQSGGYTYHTFTSNGDLVT